MEDNGGTANGGADTSTVHTISFDVTPVNDAPVTADTTITTLEDKPYTFKPADFGFSDPNDTPANALMNVIIGTLPAHGTLTLNGSPIAAGQVIPAGSIGNLVFRPDSNVNGPDGFSFRVQDNGGTANGGADTSVEHTINFDVTPVNDPPVVIDPTNPGTALNPQPAADLLHLIPAVSMTDGATLTPIKTGAYFADPDMDTLTFMLEPATTPAWLHIDAVTGNLTGTAPPDASQLTNSGTPGTYVVTVIATDPSGTSAHLPVTLHIANLPPVAANDTVNTPEHGPAATGNVLGNDHDTLPDSDPLTVTGATTSSGAVVTLGRPNRLPEGGTFTLNVDGSYRFDPGADFTSLAVGESKTVMVRYVISDGNGGSATAALTLTVHGQNDAPISGNGPAMQHGTDAAQVTPVDASAFFKDPDHGDALTYMASNLPKGLVIDPVTGVISGIIDSHASVKGPYVVTVTATDTHGGHADAIITWAVNNPPPMALGEHETTTAGVPLKATLAGNDTDPDGDALHYAVHIGPSHGTLTLNPDGTYTYEADSQYAGPDSFVYAVIDADGGVAYATCTIKVQAALNITQMAGSGRGLVLEGSHDPFQRAWTGTDGVQEYIHPVASDDDGIADAAGGSEHIRLVVEGAPQVLDRQYGAGLLDAPMRSALGIGNEARGSGATVFEPMADMPFWHGLKPLDLSPHQQAAALIQPQAVASDWDLADAPAQRFTERRLVSRSQFDRNALQLTVDLVAAA